MSGPLPLGPGALLGAALLLLLNGGLSLWLGLGLEKKVLVAALRSTVQLLLLGYVLAPVFALEHPAPVLGLGGLMILLAGREAARRPHRGYARMTLDAVVSLLVAGGLTALLATAVLVRAQPWYQPRYLIPLLGMILGNSLTGISLALDRCLDHLDTRRAEVEWWLARGATRWEAARPVAAEATRAGLIPILNTLSVVGLVQIPGMMTGQILGGTPPTLAARYQLLILFLIAGATALGVLGVVGLATRRLFDDHHRLRTDRLVGRD